MARTLLVGAFALAVASPALAQEAYFVALDTTVNQCRVMSTEPDGTAMKMIGSSSYETLDEATEAMSSLPECQT